ncbi:aminoglycoside phosphotransferase family protein, partial [Streptomyces sp. NPDC087850]
MDEARAREILAATGLPRTRNAELLALGENAVFATAGPDGPVVKIGRNATDHPELLERARREVALASWLAEWEVPAVRAAEPAARSVDGHPVTVWHRLPAAVRPAGPADLVALLRLVHALPTPSAFSLPRRELLGGVERWLRLAGD